MEEDYLTIKQIVKELDVSDKTVRRWIASGELPHTLDVLKRYRVSRKDLDEFVRRRTQGIDKSNHA